MTLFLPLDLILVIKIMIKLTNYTQKNSTNLPIVCRYILINWGELICTLLMLFAGKYPKPCLPYSWARSINYKILDAKNEETFVGFDPNQLYKCIFLDTEKKTTVATVLPEDQQRLGTFPCEFQSNMT